MIIEICHFLIPCSYRLHDELRDTDRTKNVGTYPFATFIKRSVSCSHVYTKNILYHYEHKKLFPGDVDEDEDSCSLLSDIVILRSYFQIERYFVYASWNNKNSVSLEFDTRGIFFVKYNIRTFSYDTFVNLLSCISNQSLITHYLWLNLSNN